MMRLFALLFTIAFIISACDQQSSDFDNKEKPTEDWDKFSYSIAYQWGESLRMDSLDKKLNIDYVLKGINDGLYGKDSLLTMEERMESQKVGEEILNRRNMLNMLNESRPLPTKDQMEPAHWENLQAGKAMLEKNKENIDDLIILPSGIQIEVKKEGTGRKPNIDDFVKANIIATTQSGVTFDNSYEKGRPEIFPAGAVMPGMALAFLEMKAGSEFVVYVPTEKGLAEFGYEEKVKPFEALIFDIELIEVLSEEEARKQMEEQGMPMPPNMR